MPRVVLHVSGHQIVELPRILLYPLFFFFFQAEDGIRDTSVTGVQTCALPISCLWSPSRPVLRGAERRPSGPRSTGLLGDQRQAQRLQQVHDVPQLGVGPADQEIGRASCREGVENAVGAATVNTKQK